MIPYITPQDDYIIGPNGEELRNLISQVLENKNDIQAIIEGSKVLAELGIQVVGKIDGANQLPDPATYTGNYGDAYLVGEEKPYSFYIFTRPFEGQSTPQWFNLGEFPVPGPRGEKGDRGEKGEKGDPGEDLLSGIAEEGFPLNAPVGAVFLDVQTGYLWRKNQYAWERYKNITGPAGPIGPVGAKGAKGDPGPQGPEGPQGEPGFAITFKGLVTSTEELPDPYTVPRSQGYIVGTAADNAYPYIIIEDALGDLKWQRVNGLTAFATAIYNNGNFVENLDFNQIDNTDKLNKPETRGLVYYNNVTQETEGMEATYEVLPSGIVRRNANGRIQVPNSIGDGTQALNFYTAKIALGVNYLSNFSSSVLERSYAVGGQTTFGWGPGETGSGYSGRITNYLISESTKEELDNNGHLRLLNCTSATQTAYIRYCIKYRGTNPLLDVYVATDKATVYAIESDEQTSTATLAIELQPKSSISLDSRIVEKNSVRYTQHFIY